MASVELGLTAPAVRPVRRRVAPALSARLTVVAVSKSEAM